MKTIYFTYQKEKKYINIIIILIVIMINKYRHKNTLFHLIFFFFQNIIQYFIYSFFRFDCFSLTY